MKKKKNVFCLEGDWWNNLRKRSTVEPILDLLANAEGYRFDYIHLRVHNRTTFDQFVEKWTQKRYKDYPILYLGFHGTEGQLHISAASRSENTVDLKEFSAQLEGKCEGRVIIFAGCSTVRVHGRKLKSFLDKTGALAVCGYVSTVDWILATAFELILMQLLQSSAFTRPGLAAVQKKINKMIKTTSKTLGFRMVIKPRQKTRTKGR